MASWISPQTLWMRWCSSNNVIITALDKQEPVKTKLVRDTHHQPWLIKKSKQKSSYDIRKKGNGYENSLNIHGGLSTINVDMSQTCSKQHNEIISR